MERQLARVVNKGLAGEPIIHALQIQETLQIIDYEQIHLVSQNGETRTAVIPNDPDSFIQRDGHSGYVSVDENGIATIYLD
jgi:hypothetical protein